VEDVGGASAQSRTLRPVTIVWLLGLSQIIGYGTLYYSFAIMAEDAATSFGWPISWLFGGFSLALLMGGLAAPEVGRRIDRHGAGAVMAVGSLLCSMCLLAAAFAPTGVMFVAAVIAMQVVATFVLYDAAFAALVQATGSEAQTRITHLTLIAGFASTIFWPLTAWLHGMFGWREIYVGFAIANLVVCVPIHVLLSRHQGEVRRRTGGDPIAQVEPARVAAGWTQRQLLWLVTAGFALSGFALSAMLAQMVPTLAALGLGGGAILVSALFGPAQVLIRFLNMVAGVGRHPIVPTIIAVGMVPAAIALLAFTAPWAAGAALFAVLLGFGSGLKSIVQGTLPLALFGSGSYGARLGFMSSVRQILAAIAPFAFALLAEQSGTVTALVVISIIALTGLACMTVVAWASRS
jgi:MFS family permease